MDGKSIIKGNVSSLVEEKKKLKKRKTGRKLEGKKTINKWTFARS